MPPKMQKVLIKEDEIEKIESSWISYLSNSYWFKELEKVGTSKKSVVDMYYTLKNRFGNTPLIADVMWGVFNNSILDSIRENNQKKQNLIRILMDKFKKMESEGKELWAS